MQQSRKLQSSFYHSVSLAGLVFARFTISAGNFVFPFLTLFLTQKLGFSTEAAGTTMSVLASAGLVGALLGGFAIDTIGTRWILILAALLSVVAYGLLPLFSSLPIILSLLFVGLFAVAIYEPAFNSFVAISFSKAKLRKTYSAMYVAGNLGFIVGPFAASQLFDSHTSLLFWGDAAATFASCIFILLVMAYKRSAQTQTPSGLRKTHIELDAAAHEQFQRREAIPFSPKHLTFFCLAFSFWPLILSQLFFALPLFCSRTFGEEGVMYFGYVTVLNGVLVVASTPVLNRLTQHLSMIGTVILGGCFYAVGFGSLYFAKGLPLLLLSTFIWTIGEVLSNPNARALIAIHANETQRGKLLGILDFSVECGYLAGPFLMGIFMAYAKDPKFSWVVVTILMLIGIAAMAALRHRAKIDSTQALRHL